MNHLKNLFNNDLNKSKEDDNPIMDNIMDKKENLIIKGKNLLFQHLLQQKK